MVMKKFIVCTSINPPTEALIAFNNLPGWELLVVADIKTPVNEYRSLGIRIMCVEEQEKLYPILSELLGWHTVNRRNLGFLYAWEQGCEILAMVDDDNIPMENWCKNVVLGKSRTVDIYETPEIVFDPMMGTEHKDIPHRGYPLEISRAGTRLLFSAVNRTFHIQADFWNNDPDVDAMFRMRDRKLFREFKFLNSFASSSFSPFNMQNTFIHRDMARYMISIPFTGRMCDIWGAYYLEAHYLSYGLSSNGVVYSPSSVEHRQERSWSSLCNDLQNEILGYRCTLKLLNDLKKDPEAIHKHITARSSEFIRTYQERF